MFNRLAPCYYIQYNLEWFIWYRRWHFYGAGDFLLQVSQTRTSEFQPRSGTGRRFCEQSSHTAWPHERQWCLLLSPMPDATISLESLSSSGVELEEPVALDIRASAVPNGFVHTQQKFASRSLSGTQYDGRAESLIKSGIHFDIDWMN